MLKIEGKTAVTGCTRWNKLLILLLLGFQFIALEAQELGSGETPVQDQEVSQYQHWLDLMAADQSFADRSAEIGRTSAFLEFLGQGSTVFREGPVDALELYSSEIFQNNANEISWEAHYVDVSRAGDLGLTAGPLNFLADESTGQFGHLISIWQRQEDRWVLMADIVADIPGFLSLEVEPNFDDTRPVLEETAHPVMATAETNNMQMLIDRDNLFGQSINFRGGQRALLRYGLENTRVYLPGMAPAVGADAASSVYGAFLDNQLSTTNQISLTHVGGFLSASKEVGYTYGTMETLEDDSQQSFRTSYMRLWRFTESNEWKIAVEALNPY
jgi:ketosteroid isomerase-like protein